MQEEKGSCLLPPQASPSPSRVPHGTLGEAEAGDEGRTVSPPAGLATLQSLPVNWEGGGYPGPEIPRLLHAYPYDTWQLVAGTCLA